MRKHGVPIARTVLVKQALGDRFTLRFICELVPDALKEGEGEGGSAPLSVTHGVALFASICSGVLAENTAEASVAAILPYILSGMASANVDLKAATYLIVSQLAAVATLEPHLCSALVGAVVKSVKAPLVNEALLAMVLLCQTQQQRIRSLPAGAASNAILSLESLPQHLAEISRKYNASAFVELVLNAMFEAAVADASALPPLLDVLQEVPLSSALAFRVGEMVVHAYTAVRGTDQKAKKIPSPLLKAVGQCLTKTASLPFLLSRTLDGDRPVPVLHPPCFTLRRRLLLGGMAKLPISARSCLRPLHAGFYIVADMRVVLMTHLRLCFYRQRLGRN